MADKSNFILKWKIDNASATFAARKAKSPVFHGGGFEWIASIQPHIDGDDDFAAFSLSCANQRGGKWKCETNVEFIIPYCPAWEDDRLVFHAEEPAHEIIQISCAYLNYVIYNDILDVEFHVNIISSEIIEPMDLTKFSSPIELHNITLVVGDKNLRVSKTYLAHHSPVFAAMFFGDFAEKGKDEVEIKDVVYEEFIDLLEVIFVKAAQITDRSVLHIHKLADRFQLEDVMDLSVKHLTESKRFDAATKLLFADQYRLISLRDKVLQSFTSAADLLAQLKVPPECANFSSETKNAIYDRLLKI